MTQELNAIRVEVEQALMLCDSETADALIGEPQPDEYGTLIRGANAVYQMLWMMVKGSGFQNTPNSIRMGAQALTMLLTIVHYAFAIGVQYGREFDDSELADVPDDGLDYFCDSLIKESERDAAMEDARERFVERVLAP